MVPIPVPRKRVHVSKYAQRRNYPRRIVTSISFTRDGLFKTYVKRQCVAGHSLRVCTCMSHGHSLRSTRLNTGHMRMIRSKLPEHRPNFTVLFTSCSILQPNGGYHSTHIHVNFSCLTLPSLYPCPRQSPQLTHVCASFVPPF